MNTQVLPVNEESIALAAKLLQQGELGSSADRNGVRHCRRCPQPVRLSKNLNAKAKARP